MQKYVRAYLDGVAVTAMLLFTYRWIGPELISSADDIRVFIGILLCFVFTPVGLAYYTYDSFKRFMKE